MGDPDKAFVPASSVSPSGVRWRVLVLLLAMIALGHFNRISMPVAGAEQILKNSSTITETQMGWVYSSYLIIYTLAMTPGGRLIDRWGPRRSLMLLGFGSAGFVILTGFVGMALSSAGLLVGGLFVVRGCLGVVSAPLHPAGARVVSFWFPPGIWAGINGVTTAAACIGIASTFFVFGEIMDRVGWPTAFMIAGGVTALLALAWTAVVTDRPGQHPRVNAAERALIEEGQHDDAVTSDDPTAGLGNLLRNRSLVFLTLSYGAVNYFEYLFFYWMGYYFENTLKLPKTESRLYSTVCILAMGAGMLAGGGLADWLQRHWSRQARRIVPAVGMTLSALLLVLGLLSSQPVWIVTWFALALAAIGTTEGPSWTTAVELGGRQGGTAAAICNTGGNAGGLLAPILTPMLAQELGWAGAVAVGSLYCLFGAVLWKWIQLPPPRTVTESIRSRVALADAPG
jgi:MFS family permease